jgi:glycosyltransferase involved in cell wall biosynthesis
MIEPRTPVTILVPIYNGSKHIRLGLDSIAGMASIYDEILLIDDGSEDDSVIQIKEFARNFQNINFISRQHFGLVDTLNFGIRESANTLIARADIDDLYSPNRIQRQVEMISSSINIAAVFSDYRFISENHIDLGILPAAVHPELMQLSLINHQRTPHSSVLFNKDSVIEAGGYLSNDFPAEDLALWIRLSRFSKLSSVPEVLLNYTINPTGITESSKTIMRMKTRTLQQSLLQDLDFESILPNLNFMLHAYSKMPLGNTRQALALRDLLTLSQMTRDSRFARLRDFSRLTRSFNMPALAIPVLRLARSVNQRKKFRLVWN